MVSTACADGEICGMKTEARTSVVAGVPEEDQLRGQFYWLIARWLLAPADQRMLTDAAGLGSDDTEIGRALGLLAARSREATPASAAAEYHDLFIGVAR